MPPRLVPFDPSALRRVLVVGLGVTGRAVADALVRRGVQVLVADDRPDVETPSGTRRIAVADLAAAVAEVDGVAPAPGVARHHPAQRLAEAAGVPILSELDLASAWTDRPVVAVTATNGKTTVTSVITDLLTAAGVDAEMVGNADEPLVAAIDRRGDRPPDRWVVEASSFRLDAVQHFSADVAVWLNFAPDHLDWHPDLADYEAAKARLFDLQRPGGVAIGVASDAVVRRHLADVGATAVLVGPPDGEWRIDDDVLVTPAGPIELGGRPRLGRPHELVDLAAAAAAVAHCGVEPADLIDRIVGFDGLAHRLQVVATVGGVTFHDDSKATTPHATLAALSGFEGAVLIAGGRSKGVDLGELSVLADRLVAVVGIGEAATEVSAAFCGLVPVERASDMDDAVRTARRLARPGGDVVLSPACASFDAYPGYAARGDDFARAVAELDR